jgi:hypothetical protein
VLNMVIKMYETARVGPNFPLAVLRDRNNCLSCGYKKVCYGEKGTTVLSAAVAQLIRENPRERRVMMGDRRDAISASENSYEQ